MPSEENVFELLHENTRVPEFCKLVCLSAPFDWAWLQGNSRARRRRSTVLALAGFGFPRGLPASPFDTHKQSAPDPPKNSLAGLESGPLCSGSPQPIGARKEDKQYFARIASLSSVFSAKTLKAAPHRAAPSTPVFHSPRAWAGKRKVAASTRPAPNGIAS